jgi:hypothetical protein
VETDMSAPLLDNAAGDAIRAQSPLNRAATPQEIARVVVFLATPGAEYMTGTIVDVNGVLPANMTRPSPTISARRAPPSRSSMIGAVSRTPRIQLRWIQVAVDGIPCRSTRKSMYQPGGARLWLGVAVMSSESSSREVISRSTRRWPLSKE